MTLPKNVSSKEAVVHRFDHTQLPEKSQLVRVSGKSIDRQLQNTKLVIFPFHGSLPSGIGCLLDTLSASS